MKALAHRLPAHVRPTLYQVTLRTDPDSPGFSGHVDIHLDVKSTTTTVEMHSRELTLSDARWSGELPLTIVLDPARQIVRFTSQTALPAGKGVLSVRFAGALAPSMHGIYLASDGSSRCVCTQCEATDARAIFPCFDEPEFKAQLEWKLITPEGLVALSNGPHLSDTPDASQPGHRVWSFAPTRPVSSYLAAVAVGDLESSPERVVDGIPLKVWATRGKAAQTAFALDYTARLLPWYEDYFAVKYPFAKYDQVAVPGFDAGAMENIGLVLFRQNLLLMDAGTASWRQEKVIAKVIAHEFAHMWFGNLVTMKWWDDLWLNEAFAEWMAHKAVHALSPDYRVWDDFQDDKNRALIDDALPATHPIWTDVETPDQAIEMFDVITYQKGCAVMRMLESFLGETAFREGLRRYMKTYAYANAAGPDLWRELEAASAQPVDALMKSWIAVSGFPLVNVSASADGTVRLAQRRFYSNSERAKAPGDTLWSIPVVVRYADDAGVHEHRVIFGAREDTVKVPVTGKLTWLYANASEIGFYRTNPDAETLRALLAHGLPHLSAVERMGLLEDQWALVRNATSTIERFLDVLEAMTRGAPAPIADHNVLRAVVDRLGTVESLLEDAEDTATLARFRGWVRTQFAQALAELGLSPRTQDTQNDVQRRAILLHAVARLGRDEAALAQATTLAEAERTDPRAVDPNLVGVVLGISAMLGDDARYTTWLDTYRARKASGQPPQVSMRYLYTLAEFKPEALVARTLSLLDDGTVPQEAVGPVLGQVFGSRHGRYAAWAYVQRTWDALRVRVGDMGLSRVVEAVASLPYAERAAIVAFFEAHPPTGAERALARALERIDEREELRRRVTPGLLGRFAS